MKKDMYKLKLNESMMIKENSEVDVIITRVPVGWIYEYHALFISAVFVPYYYEPMEIR
jgi:hypothetical protein